MAAINILVRPPLGAKELAAVRLAGHDRPSSLAAPPRLLRTIWRLLGLREPTHLACPRLEALRRYAILRRHRPQLAAAAERQLRDCGFDDAALLAIRAAVAPVHQVRTPVRQGWAYAACRLPQFGAAWLSGGIGGVALLLTTSLLGRLLLLFRCDEPKPSAQQIPSACSTAAT